MKIYRLKTQHQFMMDVAIGKKTFEVRFNDRNYQVGDRLLLLGWDNKKKEYTGQEIETEITYILIGGQFGIEKGFVVMGIEVNERKN